MQLQTLNASTLADRLQKVLFEELRIRADFEKAELLDDDDLCAWSMHDSGACGRAAYCDGIPYTSTPPLFASSKILKASWQQGWIDAEENAEMSICPHCNSDSGLPCPTHD
ncbi:hypothetical protein [Pseudomonas chlororaphis]|uniref:hypothetical protein n=1 Tax=Pseudomonas chlororaphis TaxID=587753 RepID=UPI00132F8C96|nr:hypothetical protein [Pseudomonas chlororaphis]